MNKYVFLVGKKLNNYTLKDFLLESDISQEIIKSIKIGGIKVNGKLNQNINDKVHIRDKVEITLPIGEVNKYAKPIKGDLRILYEDEYFLAVVKEKGIITHSSKYDKTLSLEELVLGYFAPTPFVFRPINRLDKDTLGIVIIAKDMLSASKLNDLIKDGKIEKRYKAVAVGSPKKRKFIIEKPIKRQSENSVKRGCCEDGKYAKTIVKVEKLLPDNKFLADIKLITGRTHQIRVHLSSIGYPLYADSLYGEKVEGETFSLTAYLLKFKHPFTKKQIVLKMENSAI